MNAPGRPKHRRTRHGKAAGVEPTIFVDLDGTLVWTWTPLITSSFMSQVFGLPISTPPKPKEGYRRMTKVPFEDGKYTLTCCRPNIRRFLRSLRTLAEVCLLTHASRDYALHMNVAFKLGFVDSQIFTVKDDYHVLIARESSQRQLTVLVDDEGPGWSQRWQGRTNYVSYDHRADARHRSKCHCIGIKPGSRRDIPYPRFNGWRDDLFLRASLRRFIVQRVDKVLKRQLQKQAQSFKT
ncbi:MAG: hypothetical protein IPP19_03855 [Verrucomicrobia bacterium]|nr:hypothetical protein [Verrucomicrobiota bacterium]